MEIRTLRYFLAVAREENMTRAADDPLARKETFSPGDLKGLPLFCSEQSWRREIADWAGDSFESILLEESFRLSYNGSVFAGAGLGYLLTFEHLIDVPPKSGLVFRPLQPCLETKMHLAWKKHQPFTPIAVQFLEQMTKICQRT